MKKISKKKIIPIIIIAIALVVNGEEVPYTSITYNLTISGLEF